MAIRAFALPGDIPLMEAIIPPSFEYPENPTWSIQGDEAESMVEAFKGMRRLWPLIRVMQVFSPPLRDIMRGYVWEEDGQAVGLTNVLRGGNTDQWLIGNVSVLPEYRRRGIARKLVEASVNYARERGASQITLEVIDGNVPAVKLYEALGFETFDGKSELDYTPGARVEPVLLPEGYTVEPGDLFDSRTMYELAQRITPEQVTKYRPVEQGTFQQPRILRPIVPLIFRAMGSRPYLFIVRHDASGQVVALMVAQMRLRAGGVNNMTLMLDPAHGAIAPALVNFLLRAIAQRAPGRRVSMQAAHWQQPVIDAALEAGFTRRLDYIAMGIVV